MYQPAEQPITTPATTTRIVFAQSAGVQRRCDHRAIADSGNGRAGSTGPAGAANGLARTGAAGRGAAGGGVLTFFGFGGASGVGTSASFGGGGWPGTAWPACCAAGL